MFQKGLTEFSGLIFQEDYRPEEEDDDATNAVDSKSFFAPSDGASFHANSFMELHLSRPLLLACEALGYAQPTPIQVSLYRRFIRTLSQ